MQQGPSPKKQEEEEVRRYTPTQISNVLQLAISRMDTSEPQIFKLPYEVFAANIFLKLVSHLDEIGDIELLGSEALNKLNVEIEEAIIAIKENGEKNASNKKIKYELSHVLNHVYGHLVSTTFYNSDILQSADQSINIQLHLAGAIFGNLLRNTLNNLHKFQEGWSKYKYTSVGEKIETILSSDDIELIQQGFVDFIGQLTMIDPLRAKCFHNLIYFLNTLPKENMDNFQLSAVFAPVICRVLQLDGVFLPDILKREEVKDDDRIKEKEKEKEKEKTPMAKQFDFFSTIFTAILDMQYLERQHFSLAYSPELYSAYSQESFARILPYYINADILSSEPSTSMSIECSRKIFENELKSNGSNASGIQNSFKSFLGQLIAIKQPRIAKIFHQCLFALRKSDVDYENRNFITLAFCKALQLEGKILPGEKEREQDYFDFLVKTLVKAEIVNNPFMIKFYKDELQRSYTASLISMKRQQGDPWKGKPDVDTRNLSFNRRFKQMLISHPRSWEDSREVQRKYLEQAHEVHYKDLEQAHEENEEKEAKEENEGCANMRSLAPKNSIVASKNSIIVTRQRAASTGEVVNKPKLTPANEFSPPSRQRNVIVRGENTGPLVHAYGAARGKKESKQTTKEGEKEDNIIKTTLNNG